ncbi:glutaminase, partial [Francisella tularensis]|nr:glutaminase [Francisella tularensis]
LNKYDLPHNPMINSGAIMMCSLIKPEWNIADRFEYITNVWQDNYLRRLSTTILCTINCKNYHILYSY